MPENIHSTPAHRGGWSANDATRTFHFGGKSPEIPFGGSRWADLTRLKSNQIARISFFERWGYVQGDGGTSSRLLVLSSDGSCTLAVQLNPFISSPLFFFILIYLLLILHSFMHVQGAGSCVYSAQLLFCADTDRKSLLGLSCYSTMYMYISYIVALLVC